MKAGLSAHYIYPAGGGSIAGTGGRGCSGGARRGLDAFMVMVVMTPCLCRRCRPLRRRLRALYIALKLRERALRLSQIARRQRLAQRREVGCQRAAAGSGG